MRDSVWNALAKSKGFINIKDLLENCYLRHNRSATSIAEVLGCSEATIYNLLDLHGIPKRLKTHKVVKIQKKELLNVSIRELAKKYAVSPSFIWRMRNKLKGTTP